MSAPGVTWEPATFTTPLRHGAAAVLLVASTAGLLTAPHPPLTATATAPPAVRTAAARADRAERPPLPGVLLAPATFGVLPLVLLLPRPPAPVIRPPAAVAAQATAPAPAARTARARPARLTRPARAARSHTRTEAAPAYTTIATGTIAAVIAAAMRLRGTPYVWGAASSRGVDCSGLTMLAYQAAGLALPHNAAAQSRYGRSVSYAEAQPGDLLIFYGGRHAALYLGGGLMISASKPGVPVRVSSVWDRPTSVRRLIG